MPALPSSPSTGAPSAGNNLKNYALGIINANPGQTLAVQRFQQMIANYNWDAGSQVQIDGYWQQALSYQQSQNAAHYVTTAPPPVQPSLQAIPTPPGQTPSNLATYVPPTSYPQQIVSGSGGQTYQPQAGGPVVVNVDMNAVAAQIQALAARNPALDMNAVAQVLAQIEQQHQANQNAITAQLIAALQNVVNQGVADHQQFLAKLAEVPNQAAVNNIPGTGITADQFAAGIAAIQAQPASPETKALLELYNKNADRWNALADKFGVDPAVFITKTITDTLRNPEFVGVGGTSEVDPVKKTWDEEGPDILKLVGIVLQSFVAFITDPDHAADRIADITTGTVKQPILDSIIAQKEQLDAIVNKLQKGSYKKFSDLINDFTAAGGQGGLLQGVLNLGALLLLPVRAIIAGSTPIAQEIEQLSRAEHPIGLLNPADVLSLFQRLKITLPQLEAELAKQGLSAARVHQLIELTRTLESPDTIRQLYLRREIDGPTHDFRLSQLGYDQQSIEDLKVVYQFVPQIQDLIRMMVRDVFREDRVREFGLDLEYPAQIEQYASQAGVSPFWSRMFWRAHWELPSVGQGYEMLHRGKITEPMLRTLMTAQDIMPNFIQPLIDVAYNVLTRVDIRRMYKAHVLNDAQMHRAHLDIGYNEQNALLLDNFVRSITLPEDETELTRLAKRAETATENAYVKGKLSRSDARARLIDLGNTPNHADALLAILDHEILATQSPVKVDTHRTRVHNAVSAAYSKGLLAHTDALNNLMAIGATNAEAQSELALLDLERDIKFKGYIADHAEQLYVNHVIDFAELTAMLGSEGFAYDEIQRISSELTLKRQLRNKRPTRSEIDKWAKSGKLSPDEYVAELRGFGYADKYVDLYTSDIYGS